MEPGIHHGISNADYHADRSAIGKSGLMAVRRSPAYYFGQYMDPNCPPEKEETESGGRLFGNMVHCALFEPQHFNNRYLVGPEVNKNTTIWKDFKAKCASVGAQPCDAEAMERAKMARDAALRNPDIRRLLSKGWGEPTVCAIDPATGVKRKVRPDWVYPVNDKEVILADGKTFASADAEEFGRVQVGKMGYDIQDPFYSDTFELASGMKVLAFVFIVIEDEYPFITAQMELRQNVRDSGRRKYRKALDTYAECLKTGVWPGLGDDLKTVDVPPWHLEQE